jgi:hypothetical protein
MATKTTEETVGIKAPAELTAEEINMLYQLAKQASISVSNIGQVYQVIQHTEQYLMANLKK